MNCIVINTTSKYPNTEPDPTISASPLKAITYALKVQGPVSKISQSLEATRFVYSDVRLLWDFKATRTLYYSISCLWDLSRSHDKTCHRILKQGPNMGIGSSHAVTETFLSDIQCCFDHMCTCGMYSTTVNRRWLFSVYWIKMGVMQADNVLHLALFSISIMMDMITLSVNPVCNYLTNTIICWWCLHILNSQSEVVKSVLFWKLPCLR